MERITIDSDETLAEARGRVLARTRDEASQNGLQEKIESTRWIVDAVRKNGDTALADFTQRFDGVALEPSQFELTPDEIDEAVSGVDPKLVAVLERAHDNIRRFHEKNLRISWEETLEDGTVLGQRITPIDSAGVYVPGGKAFYPSSVLMNVVPARVAGVKEIVMVSPPTYEGSIHPGVIAAARIAGATRLFRVGGAQAVAALAYGTDSVPAVCKITGPGNTYVTAAKALVRSVAEIDSEAGPSEVVVIAGEKADPRCVAYEMLAQAEHDEEAMAVLITPSSALAKAVEEYLEREVPRMARRELIEQALAQAGAIIVTRNLEEAIELTNLYAPEHLSIQTEFPRKVADSIQHAGAIMLGEDTPVAVGDYYAGPNHILPTRAKARFSSPLSAEDFRKVSSLLYYSRERLEAQAQDIMDLAGVEGLQAHARAVQIRLQPKDQA